MLPHIATVRANFAAHCASVAFGSFLHNVFIQLPSVSPACKQQQSTTVYSENLFVLKSLKLVLMHTTNVVVQLVTTGERLTAIFAIVNKGPIEMNVFNVFSQVVSVLSSFPTQCASVKFLTILGSKMVNVPVQLLVLILAGNTH